MKNVSVAIANSTGIDCSRRRVMKRSMGYVAATVPVASERGFQPQVSLPARSSPGRDWRLEAAVTGNRDGCRHSMTGFEIHILVRMPVDQRGIPAVNARTHQARMRVVIHRNE